MKLKTKQTTEVEVEINLPYFFESKSGIKYAALNESSAIMIAGDSITLFNYTSVVLQNLGGSTELTPEQFTAEYDKVLNKLGELKSEFFKSKQ